MVLKLYNTLTKTKEALKGKNIKMYTCGPTVYDRVHVGNLRAYMFIDLLKRWLDFKGYKVKHIMNITDIDDKLIKKSAGSKIKLKTITQEYEKLFFEDLKELNINKAEINPRATEHIKEMIEIIEVLLKKGYAYKADDGIYFSIKKFRDYGKLSKLDLKGLKAGASKRVSEDEYDKASAQDFALWKFYNKEDGNIVWKTSFGDGRPGWHIECSAMSSKYLGKQFDIHTGGIDLVFPHHENEIAQSEAAFGKKPWVRYWLHNEHLIVNGKKMSKSLGNFYTLGDLKEKDYSVNAIRYLLLSTNYRQKLNLTDKDLKASEESVKRISEFLRNSSKGKDGKEILELIKKSEKEIENAMDDDLNIATALGVMFRFIRDANKTGAGKEANRFIKEINKILGLNLEQKISVPSEVKSLAKQREKARKDKDWKEADRLRDKINKLGFTIDDTQDGWEIRLLKKVYQNQD
jgi:cysteinyl-tRNA synthetase